MRLYSGILSNVDSSAAGEGEKIPMEMRGKKRSKGQSLPSSDH
jgi:hypothetical protein